MVASGLHKEKSTMHTLQVVKFSAVDSFSPKKKILETRANCTEDKSTISSLESDDVAAVQLLWHLHRRAQIRLRTLRRHVGHQDVEVDHSRRHHQR